MNKRKYDNDTMDLEYIGEKKIKVNDDKDNNDNVDNIFLMDTFNYDLFIFRLSKLNIHMYFIYRAYHEDNDKVYIDILNSGLYNYFGRVFEIGFLYNKDFDVIFNKKLKKMINCFYKLKNKQIIKKNDLKILINDLYYIFKPDNEPIKLQKPKFNNNAINSIYEETRKYLYNEHVIMSNNIDYDTTINKFKKLYSEFEGTLRDF